MDDKPLGSIEYESPTLTVLGTVYALTLGCDKQLSGSDGFTFMGQPIVCRSA
ncbi:MAG TPA: lasso RiPP family leader peptide-containing protein [Gaiellaceae bacterium]|nr:lasso RiPP family leader peptide-containing protein [Gaiellaceae bacterium]